MVDEATSIHETVDPLQALGGDFEPRLVVDRAEGHQPGVAYDLMDPVTLGRGDVEIRLGDPFASSRHARITRQGRTLVVEDLGSTNGTLLNGEPLNGPQPLHDATASASATPSSRTFSDRMLVAVEISVLTDVGLVRRGNEDSSYAQAPVFAVADGMAVPSPGRSPRRL